MARSWSALMRPNIWKFLYLTNWAGHHLCSRFIIKAVPFCPSKLKESAYIALVRSRLEYGAPVWDPYLAKDSLEKKNHWKTYNAVQPASSKGTTDPGPVLHPCCGTWDGRTWSIAYGTLDWRCFTRLWLDIWKSAHTILGLPMQTDAPPF